MATKLLCSKGCVHVVDEDNSFIKGAFQLFPPLYSPITPVLIKNVSLVKSDISAPMSYLDNKQLFFSFGQSWARVKIDFEILLGCIDDFDNIEQIIANGLRLAEIYFDIFRASIWGAPITISALKLSKAYSFFLTDYNRGNFNPKFNTVEFSYSGYVIDTIDTSSITSFLLDIFSPIPIPSGVIETISNIISPVQSAFSSVSNSLSSIGQDFIGSLTGSATSLISSTVGGVVSSLAGSAVGGVVSSLAGPAVGGVVSSLAGSAVGDAASSFVDSSIDDLTNNIF